MLLVVIVEIWKQNTRYREKKNVYMAFYTLFHKAISAGLAQPL
jgi:hypothetical protein